jgi:hypothetical protein
MNETMSKDFKMALKDLFRNGFINTFTVKITNNRYSFNFKYSGTEDLRVYLFNKVLEIIHLCCHNYRTFLHRVAFLQTMYRLDLMYYLYLEG